VAFPVPPIANHARFAPLAQLASKVRRHLGTGGPSIWLLKAAVRYASRKKIRARNSRDPDVWRSAWERQDGTYWPTEPVAGIVEFAGIKIAIDHCEISRAGHLWLVGWAVSPGPAGLRLAADRCTVEWQATFATARPDVLQTLQLSLVGQDALVGRQIMARISDYRPGRSRLALTAGEDSALPDLVLPIVPRLERSGSMWHAVYDQMRHRGPRDVAYLETSVKLLRELRKLDWRERCAAICAAIEEAMPAGTALKVLILSRFHPNAAYLNLNLLAAARLQPSDFIVCSMGQQAIQRANEYHTNFATLGAHTARFVSAEIGTPSCELIEQFALSCQRRRSPGLIVYDDVAVASAMASLTDALRQDSLQANAWPRQFPHAGRAEPVFAEPLAADDGSGPYWRSAKAMERGGLGAVLFDPTGIDIPSIPPFEGRGYGLEYLFTSTLPDADFSGDAMIDLLEPAGQREAQVLDMLMLLAS